MTKNSVEFSKVRCGFCIYEDGQGPAIKILAGPFLSKIEAEKEAALLRERCNYPECRCPFDMGSDNECLLGKEKKLSIYAKTI